MQGCLLTDKWAEGHPFATCETKGRPYGILQACWATKALLLVVCVGYIYMEVLDYLSTQFQTASEF